VLLKAIVKITSTPSVIGVLEILIAGFVTIAISPFGDEHLERKAVNVKKNSNFIILFIVIILVI